MPFLHNEPQDGTNCKGPLSWSWGCAKTKSGCRIIGSRLFFVYAYLSYCPAKPVLQSQIR